MLLGSGHFVLKKLEGQYFWNINQECHFFIINQGGKFFEQKSGGHFF